MFLELTRKKVIGGLHRPRPGRLAPDPDDQRPGQFLGHLSLL
jgi:hypothetical protein